MHISDVSRILVLLVTFGNAVAFSPQLPKLTSVAPRSVSSSALHSQVTWVDNLLGGEGERDFSKQRETFRAQQKKKGTPEIQPGDLLAERGGDRSLYEEMSIMSELSALMYTVAYLLDKIGEGGYPLSPKFWPRKKVERKQLERTDLVLDQEWEGTPRLRRCIPARDILEFVNANEEALSQDNEITGKAKDGEVSPVTDMLLNSLQNIEAFQDENYLWSFDHHFGETGLVYAVTVNRVLKRVTVAFRGSVTGEDWLQNLSFSMVPLETPALLKDEFNEELKVHRGFKDYLLDDAIFELDLTEEQMKDQRPGKYGQILVDLEDCFNHKENGVAVHEGFQLYVTGHSLGGALSSLLAVKLAASWYVENKIKAPKPVINISVAAPYVGNKTFQKAHKLLEDKKWLRHVRVSNKNDVIPVSPPRRFLYGLFYEPYEQTGVNVHLKKGKGEHSIGYEVERTFPSQFTPRSLDRHMIWDYWGRGKEDYKDFEELTINKIYKEYADL